MFITKYYLTAAIGLLIAALLVDSVYFMVALLWISLSLFAVSFAYIMDLPGIFRKREDGSIPLYAKWIFFPFFIGVQAYNSWARRNDSVPAIQKIGPNLYLACRLFPSDADYLKEQGVSAILDATAEFDGLNWSAQDKNLAYKNVPILDHKSPHTNDVRDACNWISHHINNGRGVVIHCAMGRGRSVLILAAYLLASRTCKDVDSALQKINETRATANLNSAQYKKLVEIHQSGILQDKETLLLVVNPVSGGGKWEQYKEQIEQLLSPRYELVVETTTKQKTAKAITEQNMDKDFKVIVACGGDGTVNEVANALIDTDTCMAIIPLGTTNALSHVLLGTKSKVKPVETACEVILQSDFSQIDTALCNDEIMVLVAGLGFEQRMITMANRESKNESGELAYVQALASAIKDNDSHEYHVTIDNEERQKVVASSLVIANAAPFSTILAQGDNDEEPDPSDGFLDMTIVDTQQQIVLPLASLGIKGLTRLWLDDSNAEGVTHKKVKKIKIESDTALKYVVDGEVREGDSITIEINPSSLCVMHGL